MSEQTVYVTLSGVEIPIKPISPTKIMKAEIGVEKAFRSRDEPIDPPTYAVETAGGGVETFELDETAIEIPGDEAETKKRQIAWTAHQEALVRLKKEQFDITRKIVLNSIDLPLPEDETWIEDQEALYIEVPDDPRARWMHWLETEILHPRDIVEIIADILTLSSKGIIPEEDIDAAAKLFRRAVYSQAEGPEEQEDTSGSDADEEGELGAQPNNAGSDGSESLGDDSEPVQSVFGGR